MVSPGDAYSEWMWQAKRDLDVARAMTAQGFHEWACYASEQAVEKAAKAVRLLLATQPADLKKFDHDIARMLTPVAELAGKPQTLQRVAELAGHDQSTPYPGLRGAGYEAPGRTHDRALASEAVAIAEEAITYLDTLGARLGLFW